MQWKSRKGKKRPATMLHASVSRIPVATSTNLFIPREALTGEPGAVQNTVKAAELIKGMSFYQSCEKAVFILAAFSASSLQLWHNSREAVQSHSNSSAFYCTCVPPPGLFVSVRLVWFMPLSLSEGVFFADAEVKYWIIESWIIHHPITIFSHFHLSLKVSVQLKWKRLKCHWGEKRTILCSTVYQAGIMKQASKLVSKLKSFVVLFVGFLQSMYKMKITVLLQKQNDDKSKPKGIRKEHGKGT